MAMLKREHIKQAIEAIARRDQEIGYVLDEMLGLGRIGLPATVPGTPASEDFHFTFDDQLATVRKGNFFDAGTAAIEERLLIKYGELIKRSELIRNEQTLDYPMAAGQIRQAGLTFMVNHELTHAAAQLKSRPKNSVSLAAGYLEIKKRQQPLTVPGAVQATAAGSEGLFRGTVAANKTAYFIPFPFCMDALTQAADMNLDFFHVRFLLACRDRGVARNVFACVVNNRIEGLAYLTFKEQFLYRALEIHYIATTRGRPEPGVTSLRGIGTFLVAGVWLLWKIHYFKAKELLLDSEIGARGFYAAMGFQPRGLSGFVLKNPEGRLVKVIVEMAATLPGLHDGTVSAITRILKRQIDILRKKPGGKKSAPERGLALDLVSTCLLADFHPAFTRTVVAGLQRHRRKIPEAADLLKQAGEK